MSHTPGPWGIVNVTVDQVMAWKPCAEYTRQRVEALFAGRESLSPPDVAALNIPLQDKLWARLLVRAKYAAGGRQGRVGSAH